MTRTALFLKQSQIRELQALSNKTGAPVAELIRRAIDMYLEKRTRRG
jgi:predicted DNA-binding protein